MNKEEIEEVHKILELGKHEKNLHHKKGFGGLLFIDLSMIKFSKLNRYIKNIEQENKQLKENYKSIDKGMAYLMEQNNLYKSVIDEIREHMKYLRSLNNIYFCDIEPLETILNKIKELEEGVKWIIMKKNGT